MCRISSSLPGTRLADRRIQPISRLPALRANAYGPDKKPSTIIKSVRRVGSSSTQGSPRHDSHPDAPCWTRLADNGLGLDKVQSRSLVTRLPTQGMSAWEMAAAALVLVLPATTEAPNGPVTTVSVLEAASVLALR